MNKYLTLSLIAAGLSVSAAGFAADSHASHHESDSQAVFQTLDTNADGKLSAAEMTRLPEVMEQQRFDRMDSNHDGKIEKSEFEARAKARADRLFARMDSNGDGSISAAELKPAMGHHQKGAMSRPASEETGKPYHRDHHRWGDHHDRRHRHHGKPRTDVIFTHMDRNNDGYVSAAEWNQAAQQWHHHHHGWHKPHSEHAQGKAG